MTGEVATMFFAGRGTTASRSVGGGGLATSGAAAFAEEAVAVPDRTAASAVVVRAWSDSIDGKVTSLPARSELSTGLAPLLCATSSPSGSGARPTLGALRLDC